MRGERDRLGAEHPLFLSQYACARSREPDACSTRPSSACSLARHPRLDGPVLGETYVAGLDVAGEAFDTAREGHDATVLTIGRVQVQDGGERRRSRAPLRLDGRRARSSPGARPSRRCGSGASSASSWTQPASASRWRPPCRERSARSHVQALKLTAESKSRLGYGLLTAVNTGRLRLYAGQDADAVECERQLELCRATYRRQPDAVVLRRRTRRSRRLRHQPGADGCGGGRCGTTTSAGEEPHPLTPSPSTGRGNRTECCGLGAWIGKRRTGIGSPQERS